MKMQKQPNWKLTSAEPCVRPLRAGPTLPPPQITPPNISLETSERQINMPQNRFDQLAIIINNKINNNKSPRGSCHGWCMKCPSRVHASRVSLQPWSPFGMWFRHLRRWAQLEDGSPGMCLVLDPSWTASSLLDAVRWEAPPCLSRGPQWGNQTNLDLNPFTVSQNKPVLLFKLSLGCVSHAKKFWNSCVPFGGQDSSTDHCSCCTILS